MDINNTRLLANKIRQHALQMTNAAGSSHIGSILSIADIMAVLYDQILKFDSKNPNWPERDRFILSKGHAGVGLYAVLAEKGFFNSKELATFYQNGSKFSGHVSHKNIPGVELSTGSLGHGLSVGAGMAFALKKRKSKSKVFVLLSDGDCNEGSSWEAILFASHHELGRLIAIVDYNKIQSLKSVAETLKLEPFVDKWRSFGWSVNECDGHNYQELISKLQNIPSVNNKPYCLIAHTTKGKGVSFMENSVLWHYRSPQGEEFDRALKELSSDL